MKKTIQTLLTLVISAILCGTASYAQSTYDGIVSVDKTTHDFGDIFNYTGAQTCTFTFTNISKKPVLLVSVVSSCGCTEPEWTREPIQPGKTGTVKAVYKNEDGPYPFDKTVTVYVSDLKKPVVLHIKGTVHDKPNPVTEKSAISMGDLGLSDLVFKVGNITNNQQKSGNIVINNNGKAPLDVQFENISQGLRISVYPNPIPAQSTSTLSYTIIGSTRRWGKNWYYATPIVNGKSYKAAGKLPEKEIPVGEENFYSQENNEVGIGKNVIAFWAVTRESFTFLSDEEKNDGANPNFTKSTVSFGRVAAGTKVNLTFEYVNKGKQDSVFHKLDADCSNVKVIEMADTAPGKKGTIVVELDTKGMPKGDNIIALNLITNSPLRPVISLQIAGTIL